MLEKESEFSQKLENSKKKTVESDERVKVSFCVLCSTFDSFYSQQLDYFQFIYFCLISNIFFRIANAS